VELIALSSETNRRSYRQNLSDKRMKLLMQSGLIAGIIPTSIAKRSHQEILDFVLWQQDGKNVEQQSPV